jgi:hypothetical protein
VAAAENYRKILSALLPVGALGMSLILGAGGAEAAREMPGGPAASLASPVAERLAAIRDAVSDVTGGAAVPGDGVERLAWGNIGINIPLPIWPVWNNWGNNWHNGWNNWGNNWHNGWHNGGWHNGGWHNGGWHNR